MVFEPIDIQESAGFQSIKIPTNFKIEDDKVYLKKVGNALFVIPFHDPWQNLIASTEGFTADFMENREQPDEQKREVLD